MSVRGTIDRIRNHHLVGATARVAGLNVGVKLAGVAKEMVIASRFGFSHEMDAFTLALSVVSFFISLFAGNLGSAFLPAYVRVRNQASPEAARALLLAVAWRLTLGLGVLALIVAAGSTWWLPFLAPTWQPQEVSRLGTLVHILLPWLPFASASLLAMSAFHGEQRFAIPALTPLVPAITILACLLVTGTRDAAVLCAAITLGGVLELGVLFTLLGGLRPAAAPSEGHAQALSDVGSQFLPALGAGLLMNSTPLVDMWIAGLLPVGAVSSLAYASKVPAVVISLLAGALATTAFPAFSKLAAAGDWCGLRRLVTRGAALAFIGGVAIALVLGFFSPLIVRLLYQRGAFGPEQVVIVSDIQVLYLLQVPFYLPGILIVRMISAMRANQILLWGTIMNAVLNLTLDLLFLPSLGARGIALSTSCVYVASFCFLAFWGNRRLRQHERAIAV